MQLLPVSAKRRTERHRGGCLQGQWKCAPLLRAVRLLDAVEIGCRSSSGRSARAYSGGLHQLSSRQFFFRQATCSQINFGSFPFCVAPDWAVERFARSDKATDASGFRAGVQRFFRSRNSHHGLGARARSLLPLRPRRQRNGRYNPLRNPRMQADGASIEGSTCAFASASTLACGIPRMRTKSSSARTSRKAGFAFTAAGNMPWSR